MKIAILYICIGNYSVMWEGFYISAQKYLFLNQEKHFYVFTDSEQICKLKLPDVTFIKEKNYGWPGNTLYRFNMFCNIKDKLLNYDYIYFFNANAQFITKISDNILPNKHEKLVVAQHFGMQNMDPIFYEYDRNPRSTAYVRWGEEGKDYIQACFIGAEAKAFIEMSELLNNNIKIDEKQNIVARWHDESHINKYIIDKPYRLLPVSYVYPEVLKLPIKPMILMRDKTKFADLHILRYGNKSLSRTLSEKIEYQRRKLQKRWYYFLKKVRK